MKSNTPDTVRSLSPLVELKRIVWLESAAERIVELEAWVRNHVVAAVAVDDLKHLKISDAEQLARSRVGANVSNLAVLELCESSAGTRLQASIAVIVPRGVEHPSCWEAAAS